MTATTAWPAAKPAPMIITSLTKSPKGGSPSKASIATKKSGPLSGSRASNPRTASISIEA